MAAKLDKLIKRELELDGKLYTVTISPEGVKITPKGARKGSRCGRGSRSGLQPWPRTGRVCQPPGDRGRGPRS